MAAINLDLDYFNHPKTRRLIGLLGRGAEVLPIKLWIYCGKFHAEDGELIGYASSEIESFVEWWGKPGEAVAAMVKCGYLGTIKGGKGFVVLGFREHQGHISAYKSRAKSAAAKRWGVATLGDATSNATSNAKRKPKQCSNYTKLSVTKLSVTNTDPEGFLAFWKAFPDRRKGDKAGCLKLWNDRGLEAKSAEVLAGLNRWKKSSDWSRNGGEYIPGPHPWLNKERWIANPPAASNGDEFDPGDPDEGYEASPEMIRVMEEIQREP